MKLAGMDCNLDCYELLIRGVLQNLDEADFGARLWSKDPTLWSANAQQREIVSNSLGWLNSPKISAGMGNLSELVGELKKNGFRYVLHMGTGEYSTAPFVLQQVFGKNAPGLPLAVLDTTDPAAILELERNLPLGHTFFIEADKSGNNAENRSICEYFFEKIKSLKGSGAGANFGVITDNGSVLERLAGDRAYRRKFLNDPSIGECYSALSYFGLVPAALIGIDVSELLARATRMISGCRAGVPLSENPGAALGVMLGGLALEGKNKLTFLIPEPISSFGVWLEQLIAGSTGKDGAGIIPVIGEPVGNPGDYGDDRLFVEFRVKNEPDDFLEARTNVLREAGLPVVTIQMRDRLDLGEQFLLWEIATVTAAALLKVNPFDRPNIEEPEEYAGRLLNRVREEGRVPEARMEMAEGQLRMYQAGGAYSVSQAVSTFLDLVKENDYFAFLAYLTEDEATERGLQSIRALIRNRLRIATTIGYGPRYLHSTGQLHKGGPNTGLFILLTGDPVEDTGIPGQPYTFGMLMRAQALADFEALRKHRRRVLRIHLTGDISKGLAALEGIIRAVVPMRQKTEGGGLRTE
jgi:glucose-6-phosphate isomerase